MTATIYGIVQAIAAKARALTGMRAAPDNVPDNIAAYPFAVTYLMRAEWGGNDATWLTSRRQTYACDIHLSRLPDVGRVLAAYPELPRSLAIAVLSDETLGGACTAVETVRANFQAMGYSGVETVGYHCEIDVVVTEAKT